jgi:hypothetical protein
VAKRSWGVGMFSLLYTSYRIALSGPYHFSLFLPRIFTLFVLYEFKLFMMHAIPPFMQKAKSHLGVCPFLRHSYRNRAV